MSDYTTWVERMRFLAAMQDLEEGYEIHDAVFELVLEMEAATPAPWTESDPFAAERLLASLGATPATATKNASEFELKLRAMVALSTGRPAQTFAELADWITARLNGGDR